MSIFKKKKVETELEPIARLQVGNYIIKEWGRSMTPAGKVYNVPCITVEDAALTWRVSVESSHSRFTLLQTLLHWADVSPDGSTEVPKSTLDMVQGIIAVTFFMTTEDFIGAKGPDKKFFQDVMKAIKGYTERRIKEDAARQTPEEREKADAEALDEMRNPEKAAEEV
jgi:hypothetical protein